MALERYSIVDGDTLRRIAQRKLGNADQWWVLATLNGLTAPFIDTSGATYPAPQKVLTTGETLLVPTGSLDDRAIVRAQTDAAPDLYSILLGRDLALSADGDLTGNVATTDFDTVVGADNLVAAVWRRFRTRKGELVYHPEYGSDVWLYLGQTMDEATIGLLRLEARRTLLAEPRIKAVLSLSVTADMQTVTIVALAAVIGADDVVPLNLVLPPAA